MFEMDEDTKELKLAEDPGAVDTSHEALKSLETNSAKCEVKSLKEL